MDKRRQSILKQDGRVPLQETVIPDFPEEDTATVTVTKSRRVSFGANFVKEFIVGSAVSAQFVSEYEQAVSSSDSSNQNTSRSGILDQSTFQSEDDALNLCLKQALQDEFGPLKKKFCPEKLNSYCELHERNNENMWDFNVSTGSNIFTEKNIGISNKPELQRNNIKCSKKANPLNDSSVMNKQLQNKGSESELVSSKLDETLEKKGKIGKFSSTIFFSADSPTADVEFTEGCISLAKSIFDKKKKEMTVYIKGTPKERKNNDKTDGSNTVIFESDDSDVGLKLTKCVDESEAENDMSTGNISKYFPIPNNSAESSSDFDESHENIENAPLHMYSLNTVLGRSENSQGDAELERSLFFPERSLTEMLYSDPMKTTINDVLSSEKDNTEECDMEISNPDLLKTAALDEDLKDGKAEAEFGPVKVSSPPTSPHSDEKQDECTSPIFSKVAVGGDLSFTSEDNTESGFSIADPLKISICDDVSLNGDSDLDLSNCCPLKIDPGELPDFKVEQETTGIGGDVTANAYASSSEDLDHSASGEESGRCHSTPDNQENSGKVLNDSSPSVDEDKEKIRTGNCAKPPEGEEDNADRSEMEMSTYEVNFMPDKYSSDVVDTDHLESFQGTAVNGQNESSCIQETEFDRSSFLNRSLSLCEEGDGTSLGDKKIISLLSEQSGESNCCWTMDSAHRGNDINVWSFSFPIMKSSGIMKFKLRPPKDKSLVSFSVVIDGSLELHESKEDHQEKHRIGIEYAFGKLKTYFLRESRGLDNVHKMPLFMDKMNLVMNKMNGVLRQMIRILKEYPGSKLEESVLSFRIYSFPLLFSYLIAVDVSDPFKLSDNSVAVKKHFGDFNTNRVKSIFTECLANEDSLVSYIRKLTESVVGMEREIGFTTKRSHIRLIC